MSAAHDMVAINESIPVWKRLLQMPAVRRYRRHRAAMAGAVLVLLLIMVALLASLIAPYPADHIDLNAALVPSSWAHPFGTDSLGRDVLSRIIWGARISLRIGLVSVGMGTLVGLPIGALAAFLGGWTDRLLMRLIDILLAFPPILLAILVITIYGSGLTNAMLAIGVAQTPVYARLMRASVLKVKEEPYVEAAHAAGAPEWRVLLRHVVPNSIGAVIVQATLSLAAAILSAAYLGFLGLGAQPPSPEWGAMLSKGRDFLRVAPHASIFPGLAIMVTVLAFNLVGEGLSHALDPKLNRR